MTHYTVSVEIVSETDLSKEEAKRLLRSLIDAGLEDAANSPEDWDDPDSDAAASLQVTVS